MRRRVIRGLIAIMAAGATLVLGLGAVGTASASTARHHSQRSRTTRVGTTLYTKNMAGYEAAGGRYFRYIQALITVPNLRPSNLLPHEYIQLAGTDQWVRVGITFQGGMWKTFIASQNNSLFPVHYYVPLRRLRPGDGVFFSIYFDQAGNELHFVIIPPNTHRAQYFKARARGPIFTQADALDDWTYTSGRPASLPPFARQFRINQFFEGAITTYNGDRGSFAGPWTTSKVVATTHGYPYPQNAVVVSPSYLWTDGAVANGAQRSNDAFGVWARS